MQPTEQSPGTWMRLADWVRHNRSIAWLVGFAVGLGLFLVWLPATVRLFFWHGLQTHGALAGMVVGFGLLAVSLLWSGGQRIDAWTFLFFNLRGRRPAWLDRLMWGFTQIGNSMTTVALAGILFVIGHRLLAYELVLGTLTLWLVVELVKVLAHRGRPFVRLTQTRIVGRQQGGRSFPSGHTSQAFFVATLLVGYFHPGLWAVGLLYATALRVGAAHMYVGED